MKTRNSTKAIFQITNLQPNREKNKQKNASQSKQETESCLKLGDSPLSVWNFQLYHWLRFWGMLRVFWFVLGAAFFFSFFFFFPSLFCLCSHKCAYVCLCASESMCVCVGGRARARVRVWVWVHVYVTKETPTIMWRLLCASFSYKENQQNRTWRELRVSSVHKSPEMDEDVSFWSSPPRTDYGPPWNVN